MRAQTLLPLSLAALLAAGGLACAPKSGAEAQSASYDRNVITEQEIATVEVRTSAFDLISRLRPVWLQRTMREGLMVRVNDQLHADNPLNRYVAGELREIRYLNAVDARMKYGGAFAYGTILLSTR